MHTPGPWQFYELLDHAHDGLGYIRTVPEDGLEIAHHGDSGRSWSENVANGHLLAAAPDMLAALYAAPIMSKYHGHQGFEAERFIMDYEAWRVIARAAIAKAETP